MNTIDSVVISSLFYYKEELAREFLLTLIPQMNRARRQWPMEIRLVITLNYPYKNGFWEQLWREASAMCEDKVSVELISRGYNLGFGASHNYVFNKFISDVFVVMNNDLYCEDVDWIAELIRDLQLNEGADAVGASENASVLRKSDACGLTCVQAQASDFCDGSLLMMRSASVRRYGLFSSDYKMFYFEDCDLWLRFRQAGANLKMRSVPHRHLRSASSRLMPRYVLESILDINRAAFFEKWSGYMRASKFTGRICADLRELTSELLLDVVPTLVALAKVDHPGAQMDIFVTNGALGALLESFGTVIEYARGGGLDLESYDRNWIAKTANPRSGLPPTLQHLASAGVHFHKQETVALWHAWSAADSSVVANSQSPRTALVVVGAGSAGLAGVEPSPTFYLPLIRRLGQWGYRVTVLWHGAVAPSVDFGCTTLSSDNLIDDCRLMRQSDIVVTAANRFAVLAQQMDVRCFIIVGSKVVDRVIWNWARTTAFSHPQLDCIGCQHVWGKSGRAFCLRTDEACLATDLADSCADALQDFDLRGVPSIAAGLARSQSMKLLHYRQSSDLDLSKWPED